jgi:poly(A) polymerase
VIDYVGGIEDLERRLIRAIGEPGVRFQEDPVRMLRACEFAGRLGFGIEQRTQEAIYAYRKELEKASPARVTEEVAQLLRCGHAGAAMQWMLELGLLEVILPEAYAMLTARSRGLGELNQILPVIDTLVAEERELPDTALLAALLLPKVLLRRDDIEAQQRRPMARAAIEALIQAEIEPFLQRFTLSNLKAQQIFQALLGFQRLCEPGWRFHDRVRLARKSFFPSALLLFEMLVRATGQGEEVLAQWEAARHPAAAALAVSGRESAGEGAARARNRRRRRRR